MKILIIEQTNSSGHKKSWRITPQESPAVFGSSRLAQIISQDATSTPFEGVFEFKDNHWIFHDLHRDRLENSLTCELRDETSLSFDNSVLKITCFEKKESLSEILDRSSLPTEALGSHSEKKPFQLFIVRHGAKILETRIIGMKDTFQSPKIEKCPSFKPIPTPEWKRLEVGPYEISQRTVYLSDQSDLAGMSTTDFIDRDGKKSSAIILGAAALLGLLAWLAPRGQTNFAPPETPKTVQRVIVRNEVRKKKEEKAAKEAARTPAATQPLTNPPPTENAAKSTGSKVAHLLKTFQGGRISALIGKVSAQSARSKNLIVSSGIPAGTAPSGAALSALGSSERSGRDWSTDAKGAGLTVNTEGKGGGKNTQGLGTLQGGKVGTGGVGLIEDESEVVGGLDRDIIAQYIKTQLGQILYCYERQLSAQPDLFGKVAIRFEIGSTGQVTSQKIGDTTLKNATVEGCILNKIAGWKFPAPQGGTKVMVTYPFLFKSTN